MGRLFWKFFLCILLAQVAATIGVGGVFWLRDQARQRATPVLDSGPPAAIALDAATATLRVGDCVEGERGLTRRLRAVDLDDAAAGQPAYAECDIQCDGSGRDHGDGCAVVTAEAHDRALAELAVDLCECRVEGFLAVCC